MEEEVEETVTTVGVADVAKVEITRQVIILGFSIAGTVATYYVVKKMQDPDYVSTVKMAGALMVKRWADKQADRFSRLASHMANVYNGEKL